MENHNNNLLSSSNCSINNELNLNNNKIINLGNAIEKDDVVNKKQLEDIINKQFDEIFVPKSGTLPDYPIIGNIFLNNTKIINIKDPSSELDIINLQSLPNVKTILIPLSGNSQNNPITGNLIFDSKHTLTGLKDPVNDTDIVNLQYLEKKSQDLLLLTGGTMTGNIDANHQVIMATTSLEKNAIGTALSLNGIFVNNIYDKCIPLTGTINTPGEKPVSITGNLIFDSKHTLTGLKDPVNDTDIVNLQYLEKKSQDYLTFHGGIMTGNIDANHQNILTTSHASDPLDAVNFSTLNEEINNHYSNYLHLKGNTDKNPITGNLTFNNCLIKGIANPKQDNDAVNLLTLNEESQKCLPITGEKMLGNIDLSNNLIINLANPVEISDAVNLQTLNSYKEKFKNNYVPITGNTPNNPIKGNIDLNNQFTITGIKNPKNSTDSVNLQYLKTHLNLYTPLSKGIMKGPINMNNQKLTITSKTTNKNSVINLSSFKELLSSYPQKTGNQNITPINGNLFFNNIATITGLKNPKDNTDIVNLQYLKIKLNNYLPRFGGKMNGNINMNGQKISNVRHPKEDLSALVPMSLITYSTPYIIKRRNTKDISIPWDVNEKLNWNITSSSLNKNSLTANFYFSLTNNNKNLLVLKPGNYYINITTSITKNNNSSNSSILGITLNFSDKTTQILTQTSSFPDMEKSWGTSFSIFAVEPSSLPYLSIINYTDKIFLQYFSWFITKISNV